MAFLVAMVLLSFSLSEYLGSNGYISVYLYGILIGNLKFKKKNEIVSFFNGITSIMQMLIFFLLWAYLQVQQKRLCIYHIA